MALFEIRNLTFTYPDQKKPALTDLNFSLKQGEFLVVCGKSGCGKSTLLRHFKTAMAPYGERKGQILFEGRELDTVSVREQGARIGYVLQSPDNQLVTDKVWHELAFGLENLGYETGTIRLRVAEMASFFGIQTWFEKSVEELSGGQKQLLNLAAVMAMQPDLLVLDEPTAMLDPDSRKEVINIVKELNRKEGMTIILITHHTDEVVDADRIVLMKDGKIIGDDIPKKIFADYELLKKAKMDIPPVVELGMRLEKQQIGLEGPVLQEQEMIEKIVKLYRSKCGGKKDAAR